MKPEFTVKRKCMAEPEGTQQQSNRTDMVSIEKPEGYVLAGTGMFQVDPCAWSPETKSTTLSIVTVEIRTVYANLNAFEDSGLCDA